MKNFNLRKYLAEGRLFEGENKSPKELGKELFDFLKSQGLEPGFFRDKHDADLAQKVGPSKDLAAVSLINNGNEILIVVPKFHKNVLKHQLPSIMQPQTDWQAAEEGEWVYKFNGSKGDAEIALFQFKRGDRDEKGRLIK